MAWRSMIFPSSVCDRPKKVQNSTALLWLLSGWDLIANGDQQTQDLSSIYRDGASSRWRLQRGTRCCSCGRSRKFATFQSIIAACTWLSDCRYRVCAPYCYTVIFALLHKNMPNLQVALFWMQGSEQRCARKVWLRRFPEDHEQMSRQRSRTRKVSSEIRGLVSQLTRAACSETRSHQCCPIPRDQNE